MLTVGSAIAMMGEQGKNVLPIFVTIDPQRDTAALLADYLKNFGDNFIGLTGSDEEIAAAARSFGVYYKARALNDNDYTMDHSTALYLISPSGEFMRAFGSDLTSDRLMLDILRTISSTSRTLP